MIVKKQANILGSDATITFRKFEAISIYAGFQRFNVKASLEINFTTRALRILLYSAKGSWYIISHGSVKYGGGQNFYKLSLIEAKVQIMKILTDPRK